MSYVIVAGTAVVGPWLLLAVFTQRIFTRRRRVGDRLYLTCKKLMLAVAGSAAWPGYSSPPAAVRSDDGFVRRLLCVLSGQPVADTEKGDAFELVNTEPLMELPTDYVDPNWGWIVQKSARARRHREVAEEMTPLLWRMARGMGLDRQAAEQVVLRAAVDSALRLRGQETAAVPMDHGQATAAVRAVMLAAVQREAAKLAGAGSGGIESDPLAGACDAHRCALTVMAYAHPEDVGPLLESLGAFGSAPLDWLRDQA